MLRLRRVDGSEHELPIADVTAELVLSSVPWRTFRSHHRQPYLSGYYWSSTTGGHVIYESRLELARLLLADADIEVVGIAAQPFLVIADGRRHVPDFFLARSRGGVSHGGAYCSRRGAAVDSPIVSGRSWTSNPGEAQYSR